MTQGEALKILQTGANVFLTGEPGSGKTYTVNAYVRWLREHGIEPAITASTGIAATHISGMTIHSWSGIGVREYLTEYDVEAIAENKNVKRRARGTNVLIIDEVSMLAGDTLMMVDQVLRAARESEQPFGGMQVVLVGDFFQLPPVVRRGRMEADMFSDEEGPRTPFAFTSPAWRTLNPFVCYLEEQYRQQEETFSKLLGALRRSEAGGSVHDTLGARTRKAHEAPADAPRLFSHNADVDTLNAKKLDELPGKPYTYTMTARGSDAVVASLKRGCLSPEVLVLKEKAKVMFTKNDPAGAFVNGTLGEVVSIAMDGTATVKTKAGRHIDVEPAEWKMEEGGRMLGRISQLPLRLAWAITVHKSQGMTLDEAVVDLSKAFEYGQGYVALSRVRGIGGLYLLGYNKRALEVHPHVLESDADFKESSAATREKFHLMQPGEHETYVHAFVKASGGSTEGGVTPKKRTAHKAKGSTHEETLELIKKGKSLKEVAKARKLKEGTIIDHLEALYMKEAIQKSDIVKMLSPALKRALPKINAAFKRHGTERLTPVHHELKGVYSFDDIKLARLLYSA